MNFKKLFKRSTKGKIQQWQIFVEGNSFYTEAGQVDGKITRSLPTFTEAKNVGKANATTAEEQAIVEAQANYDKKLKEKYYENIDDVDNESFISPILANPYKKRKSPLPFPVIGNIKYNGVRCIISKKGAFSRTGEQFFNIKHIIKELEPVFEQYADLVLDGELNDPNDQKNLNRLIKLVAVTRKEKDLNDELIKQSEEIVKFSVYDGYWAGKESEPYLQRYDKITDIIHKNGLKYCQEIPYEMLEDEEKMFQYAKNLIDNGYEGAIIRIINMPYEHKRSMDLLKLKRFEDAEFEVVDVEEGKGNWQGCAKKIVCRLESQYITSEHDTFKANLEGTMENARYILENKEKWIGKKITVRFQERSEYGVPLIPYTDAIIRDYE